MYTYRPVQYDDIPTICSFPQSECELFFMYPRACFPLTPEQLHASISQRVESTVVLQDGLVAGFANLYNHEPGEKCAIGNVIVAPHLRGKGVGKFLIQTMVDLAHHKYELKEVQINCFSGNSAGLLLYSALGFTPFKIEERQDRSGGRICLIHMRRLREQPLLSLTNPSASSDTEAKPQAV